MASERNGTLYIGVTNDLIRRVYQHKNDVVDGFTKEYGVHTLVYFESTSDVYQALRREKRMKKWKRKWKLDAIEEKNPTCRDLYEDFSE